MSVVVIREAFLPSCDSAVAFSIDAWRTLEPGGPGWRSVLDSAMAVVLGLADTRGHDAVAFVGPFEGLSGEAPRIGLMLAWEGDMDEADAETTAHLMEQVELPWRPEGVRHVPPDAIAIIAHQDEHMWHLWHAHNGRTVVCFFGVDVERELVLHSEPCEETDPTVFPKGLGHALAISTAVPEDDGASIIELMKVAWTLDLAERVIEADGYVRDDELDLLQRTFPPRRIRALGLVDRASCVRLRALARVELAGLIDADDKRALLGLLFRMAESDGRIVDAELDVLRTAAAELHVDWALAQTYMLEQW